MEIGHIISGHVNEMLGLNKNISEARLNICRKCPIYSTQFGGICNGRLYLNPETGDVSVKKQDGYVKGCNCRLKAKTAVMSEYCPADKW